MKKICYFSFLILLTFNGFSQSAEKGKGYKPYIDFGLNASMSIRTINKAVYGPVLGLTILNPEKHLFFSVRNATFFSLNNETTDNMLNKLGLTINNFSNISYFLIGYQIFKLGKTPASIDFGGFKNYQGGKMNYTGLSWGFAINFDWLKIELRNSVPFELGGMGPEPCPLSISLIYRFSPKKQ